MSKRIATTALLVVLSASVGWIAAAEEFHKLKAAQIQAKFSGMELTDQVHWYDFLRSQWNCSELLDGAKEAGKMVG